MATPFTAIRISSTFKEALQTQVYIFETKLANRLARRDLMKIRFEGGVNRLPVFEKKSSLNADVFSRLSAWSGYKLPTNFAIVNFCFHLLFF